MSTNNLAFTSSFRGRIKVFMLYCVCYKFQLTFENLFATKLQRKASKFQQKMLKNRDFSNFKMSAKKKNFTATGKTRSDWWIFLAVQIRKQNKDGRIEVYIHTCQRLRDF